MKSVALLILSLVAIAYSYNDACMAKTSYVCSMTQPIDSVFWSYCPLNTIWSKLPCGKFNIRENYSDSLDTISSYIDFRGWECSGGFLYRPAGNCLTQREEQREEETSEVLERVTYTTCPITGTTKVVCCKFHFLMVLIVKALHLLHVTLELPTALFVIKWMWTSLMT